MCVCVCVVVWLFVCRCEMTNDPAKALEWFKILHGSVPTDPKVLAR